MGLPGGGPFLFMRRDALKIRPSRVMPVAPIKGRGGERRLGGGALG